MTRVLLTVGLAALTLAVGLWTAVVSSYNHQRGANLTKFQRQIEIQRAANDRAEAEAAVHVWGRAEAEPLAAEAQADEPLGEEVWRP